ncbi:hypothetical protein HRI_002387800 [Hibiscus trionum]|uniref:Homeobox domain-containing protein n=1 Tax=Hibiscus trionum TaxID=183268 RepID=A0A9W7M684_HIBTR|nr:hypothetical protein HRI_002387800 [Hibiscus trionum]
MQSVVASFKCVSGLGTAAPYVCFAFKAAASHFSCLKNDILDQIRGLPEHAVAVLKTWLFEHFLHPYPSDSDKLMLARQTGLSRTQVSNWFINARVRLWKPMVEEVHNLELRQAQIQTPSPQNVRTKRPRSNVFYNAETELQKRSSSYIDRIPSNHRDLGLIGTDSFRLALGLNQNNGVELGQLPLSMNLCHNFSFGTDGELSLKPGFDVGKQ